MRNLRAICLLICLLKAVTLARGQEAQPVWEIQGTTETSGFEVDLNAGTAVYTGGVRIEYGGAVLTAREARVNRATGDVIAEGDVKLLYEGVLWTSERVRYNFKTRYIEAEKFKTGRAPYFVEGEGLSYDQNTGTYTATNALITSDDYGDPAQKIRARSITFVPDDYVEARRARLYLGDVPVFYLPWFRRSIGPRRNHFTFVPGYRSSFGPFLLGSYNWFLGESWSGSLNLDYRQERGLAGGPDARYDYGSAATGGFSFYHAEDRDPGDDLNGDPIDRERQRFHFTHRTEFTSNLVAKAAVRYQGDPFVVRDFFEAEYRNNVQPNSFLEVNQLWPDYSLNVFTQPQVNDFFETVERLPDVKFSAFRQQIGATPLYYEGDSSFGYFRRRFVTNSAPDFEAVRGDSYHQVVWPRTHFGWLNLTPRVGGRYTYYGETDGPGGGMNEQHRGVFNTGAELSFKASRVWRGARSRMFEVDELRHILEPSLNYVFVPEPNRRPPELPQFDYELDSLRLLPIDFPDYNAIDSIDSRNVLRLGLRNKLQTFRRGAVDNLLNWAVYTDWRLDPTGTQTTFSDIFSDLDLRPRSWLTLNSETRVDIHDAEMVESNHRVTVQPGNVWSVTLGHRYLRENPALGPESGNNLFTTSVYYRFNDNWGARMSHHFESRDGRMEEQYYTVYRDLRSWTAALTFRLRDNRGSPDDFTVAATFSLKAFPRFGLGDDRDEPEYLLGR